MRRALIFASMVLASACEDIPAYQQTAWQPPALADTVITPAWAERAPTAQDILRFYPEGALNAAVEGVAYLACTVNESRALDCVEGTESTPGHGFGPAAIRVSRLFVVKKDYPGVLPGVAVRLPVRFQLE